MIISPVQFEIGLIFPGWEFFSDTGRWIRFKKTKIAATTSERSTFAHIQSSSIHLFSFPVSGCF